MKKNEIILWIASLVTVFLTVYITNLFDGNYPLSSTIGIEGKKVSYRFERIHYNKDELKILIRSDLKDLKGKIFWKADNNSHLDSIDLVYIDPFLEGSIPSLQPRETAKYFVKLYYSDKVYNVPDNQQVSLVYYGKIPIVLNVLEFLLLYLSLVMAVRVGLECFNEKQKIKKFAVFTLISLITLTFLINPLYLTYKFGFMNHTVPPIEELFYASDLITIALWVITVIVISYTKKYKYLPLITSVLTLLLFAFLR